jgi:divalent metal cation (Fe/Co/Zn/Cd) transporter
MAWLAYGIVRRALPDLLDKTLSDELQMLINRALATHFERYASLGRVRSRQAGAHLMVEIELGFPPAMTLGEVDEHLAAIQGDLERDLPGGHVVLIPKVAPAH